VGFLPANFRHLATQENSSATHRKVICEKKAAKSHKIQWKKLLKSPYLDNRFQLPAGHCSIAKFLSFSTKFG
jgi:hypothetical protein